MTKELVTIVVSPLQKRVREAMGHHRSFRVDDALSVDMLERLARLDQAFERNPPAMPAT